MAVGWVEQRETHCRARWRVATMVGLACARPTLRQQSSNRPWIRGGMAMGVLLISRGERQGEIIHLTLDKTVLGRHPEFCDEIISKNEAVSRKHAQILRVHEHFFIEDLKSRNK